MSLVFKSLWMFLGPTLSVQFGELFGESVLTLLQLPFLLLHVLHVVGQRLYLGLMLQGQQHVTDTLPNPRRTLLA